MALSALVSNIQGYSIHDGPGIRTVVFLKGCPLRCRWCANPENLHDKVQIGFLPSLCKQCGRCGKVCPRGAILPGPDRRIHRDRCVRCAQCVEACCCGALVRYGEEMTVEAVYDQVRRDKIFYEASGGGVTVSGGEPLTHADVVAALFALCREEGIHTCVETCGCVPSSALERVLPLTDLFYFDLKLMDGEKHREYTGRDNGQILSNARLLAGRGVNLLFRQPLIPGVNDGEENVRATAAFLRSLGLPEPALQLLPYHRLGAAKYAALEVPYSMEALPPMQPEAAEAVCRAYLDLGIRCSISR